uniref:5'-(N(7)-methylguanosine 5'-triphospho)-[mRNA] hydrolase n=1 Tax=Propithecus coquereli TaxID=379532 RepID=A0A2K6GM36_PROCO
MAAVAAGGLVGKGRDISLAALQRHDPYINRIVDVASQVALYTFGHRANEWEKTDVEGTLFVYTSLTRCEQLKAHQGAGAGLSPVILNSGEGTEVDILRMLTKAKDEYTKCKTCSEPKKITSSSAIYDNPNLIKPIPVKPSENQQQRTPQPSQVLDSEPQHLSLTALFGKQDKATCRGAMGLPPSLHQQQQQQQEKFAVRQGVVRSLSYEEPPVEKQLCPAIRKLMVRSADLHPLSELPETRPCENGNTLSLGGVFTGPVQPGSPHNTGVSHGVQSASRTRNLLEKLQSAPGAANCSRAPTCATPVASGKGLAQPPLVYFNGSLPPQTLGRQAHRKEQCTLPRQPLPLSGDQTNNSGVISPRELLRRLQLVQQEQQLHAPNRPSLAAKFPVGTQSSGTGRPLESWISKTSSTEKQTPLFQVGSPQHGPATAAPSLLMPPLVFTQPSSAPADERDGRPLPAGGQEPPAATTSLLLPVQSPEPSVVPSGPLTKLQLQEALLYLVQNDDNFLNIIYEAYLFSTTQAAMRKTV